MTTSEPTAEARAEEIVAWLSEPSQVDTSNETLKAKIIAALDAFRKEGVEQAEKERSALNGRVEFLEEECSELDKASEFDQERIASLEAELARVREERDGWRRRTETEQQRVIRHIYERDDLHARLSPERLEKVAREICNSGSGDYERNLQRVRTVLQRELGGKE